MTAPAGPLTDPRRPPCARSPTTVRTQGVGGGAQAACRHGRDRRVDAVKVCGPDSPILKGDVTEVADGRILGHERNVRRAVAAMALSRDLE